VWKRAFGDIDAALVNGPCVELNLASAAAFRNDNGRFRLVSGSPRWDSKRSEPDSDVFKRVTKNVARRDAKIVRIHLSSDELSDVAAPAAAFPVMFAGELHAIAMYSAHTTGADIDHLEAGLLEDFTARIALAYEKYNKKSIQEELHVLRRQLAEVSKQQTI
jgi:hypothetical protein